MRLWTITGLKLIALHYAAIWYKKLLSSCCHFCTDISCGVTDIEMDIGSLAVSSDTTVHNDSTKSSDVSFFVKC